jgi:hypothetical protein
MDATQSYQLTASLNDNKVKLPFVWLLAPAIV